MEGRRVLGTFASIQSRTSRRKDSSAGEKVRFTAEGDR
jgi:hypothetical protein